MLLEINMASTSVSYIISHSLLQNTMRNLQQMELVRAFCCIYMVALYRVRKWALISPCGCNQVIIYPYGQKWAIVFSCGWKQVTLSPYSCKWALVSLCWSVKIVKRRVQLLIYFINWIQILGLMQSSSCVIFSR